MKLNFPLITTYVICFLNFETEDIIFCNFLRLYNIEVHSKNAKVKVVKSLNETKMFCLKQKKRKNCRALLFDLPHPPPGTRLLSN